MNLECAGENAEIREIIVKLLLMRCYKIHSRNGIPVMTRQKVIQEIGFICLSMKDVLDTINFTKSHSWGVSWCIQDLLSLCPLYLCFSFWLSSSTKPHLRQSYLRIILYTLLSSFSLLYPVFFLSYFVVYQNTKVIPVGF